MLSIRSILLVSIVALLSVVAATEELEIDVISKPEECTITSRSGDLLSMQWVI